MKLKIKSILIPVLMYLFANQGFAQGIYIGDEDTDPAASTILEVESSTQGVLLPRMTLAQIQAISVPAEGLMVYNTTSNQVVYFNGDNWFNADGTPAYLEVGLAYQGGIIFYVDGTGQQGWIAATADISAGAAWGCSGTTTSATSTTNGATNTTLIVGACATAGIAARLCDNYSVVDNGTTYDDWYLPAETQMTTLYGRRAVVGGFNEGFVYYWTSTEATANNARRVIFLSTAGGGTVSSRTKSNSYLVRPVRSF